MKKNFLFTLLAILVIQPLFAQVPSYVPTNGLVGYWPFNGNANDESGNGNNGTVNGATLISDRNGNSLNAYNFSNNNYIQLPNTLGFENQSQFSLSYWVQIPSNNIGGCVFNQWLTGPGGSGSNLGIQTTINSSGQIEICQLGGCPGGINYTSNVVTTTWNNITLTFNGNLTNNLKWNIYINNVFLGSFGNSQTPGLMGNSSPRLTLIGASSGFSGGPITSNFKGNIDDIGIWNRALSQQEITNLYNSANTNECLTMVINSGPLSTNPVTYTSTVNIFPNPANDQITIDCGNLANVVGWNIKITNALGQEVFSAPMNTQQYVVPLNSWSGQGMYFVKILNAQNEVVNIKKIILQ